METQYLSTTVMVYRVCLTILLFPSILLANELQEDVSKDILLMDLKKLLQMPVTSASRASESALDAPAKVRVITAQDIKDRGYVNLFDLLKGESEIDAHEYSHETTYTRLAVRGVSGNDKFIIQRNGINIGSPDGSPLAIANNFPLFNVDRVEIVFGPGTVLYGADAFSGVINLVTDNEPAQAFLGSYIGEYNHRYVYGNANYELTDNVEFHISMHTHYSDNPDLSDMHPEIFEFNDLVDFNNTVVVPSESREGYYGETRSHSLSLGLKLGSEFNLTYHQYSFESPTSTGLIADAVDYDSRASWSNRVGVLSGVYSSKLTSSIAVRTLFSHSFSRLDSQSKFNNLFSNFTDGYKFARSDKTTVDTQITSDWGENRLLMGVVF